MSDDLHKYPGNLKHHRVDKEERRKLLAEMMGDDAKDGLYDAPARREPLLRDSDLAVGMKTGVNRRMTLSEVRDYYEAARAKDAELIQRLANDVVELQAAYAKDTGRETSICNEALKAAIAQGFKP